MKDKELYVAPATEVAVMAGSQICAGSGNEYDVNPSYPIFDGEQII